MRIIRIHPDYEYLRSEIERLPEHRYTPRTVFCNRRNTVEAVDMAGLPVVVKRFRRPNMVNRIVYRFFRHSKSRRSYDNALRLLSLGFDTPAPVAVIEDTAGPVFTDSWYVSLFSPDLTIGHYVTEEDRPTMRARFASDPMLQAFRRFAATLFAAGIYQRDFNRNNFLVHRTEEGDYAFSMVDINRLEYRRVTPEMIAMAFTRFGADTAPGLVEELTVETGTSMGYSREECERAGQKAVRRGARIERRREFKRAWRRRRQRNK